MANLLPTIQTAPVERFDIYSLVGGWNDNANQDALTDQEISDGRNVEIVDNLFLEPRGGTVLKGDFQGSTTKVLGLFEYVKPSTGARAFLKVYNTDAYLLTSGEWVAQSQSLTTNKSAEFTNFLDRAYMVNGYDVARYYDGSSWTTLANFPVASATASDEPKGICTYKQRLITWNTTNFPKRVYYGNANAHTIGTLNYFDLDEPVVGCIPFFDYLLCFTENYIYRIGSFIFTGVAFEPNSVQPLPTHIGAISLRSIKHIGQFVYFLSKKGLIRTDGNNIQNISDSKIKNYMASTVSPVLLSSCPAGIDGWYYRIALSTNGTDPNEIVTYDTQRGVYFPRQTGRSISVFANYTENSIVGFLGGCYESSNVYAFNQTGYFDEVAGDEYIAGYDADSAVDASTTTRKAQSFTIDGGGIVTKLALYMKKNAGTTTELTVRIETDNAGVPSGTIVENGSTTIAAFSHTVYRYKVAEFSTPVILQAGNTYWIVVQHTTEDDGDSQYYWGSDDSSPTADGEYASYSSSEWTADDTKDLLYQVYIKQTYEKYFITRGFPLGSPQYLKIVKRLYAVFNSSGNYNAYIGLNADVYSDFREKEMNMFGNSSIRGVDLIRGFFTRGTQERISKFLKFANLRGRRIYLRVYNGGVDETFSFIGATINYRVKQVLR
jgi:hypothetical protein